MTGNLYLVATPIGNLQDITFRAVEILRTVDVIACEDTRHSAKLLNHYRISNKLVSFHEHNEQERTEEFIDRLVAGESIAVISDAGTPGICDPGYRLVARAIEAGIAIVPTPGAVAFVNAVIASGLPTDSIYFGGFLPSKKGERRKRLEQVREIPATLVFYESPHRIAKTLIDCLEVLGDRSASISRELTKLHEEISSSDLSILVNKFTGVTTKGEIVLVIGRAEASSNKLLENVTLENRVAALEKEGEDRKTALKRAAKEFGLSKSEAYRLIESSKK